MFLSYPKPSYGPDITAHDLLKAFALLTMLVDHAGHYFFPDLLWLRIIGRLSAPVWFFLIGYADTRQVQPALWIGGALVTLGRIVSGEHIFPLTTLIALAVARLSIDGVMRRALAAPQALISITVVMGVLSLPSAIVLEYGTAGFVFAMAGFICRRTRDTGLSRFVALGYLPVAAAVYVLFHMAIMRLPGPYDLPALVAAALLVSVVLMAFAPAHFPRLTRALGPLASGVKFAGRRTLEIYVAHLLLIAAAVLILRPDAYRLFNVRIVQPGMLALVVPSPAPGPSAGS